MKFSEFNIKSPEQLLQFLCDNFHWGFLDNKGNVYTGREKDFREKLDKEYRMLSPDALLLAKYGLCYDIVTFEKELFEEQKIEYKTLFINYVRNGRRGPGHTFLVYKNKKKWCWFEFVWEGGPVEIHRGIHQYDSLTKLIEDVNRRYFNTRHAPLEEYSERYIIEYDASYKPYSYAEFINHCYTGKKISVKGVTTY